MGSIKVIENVKKGDLLSEILSIFAEAESFSRQWGQRLPESQIQPLKQDGADLEAQLGKPLRTTLDAVDDSDDPTTFSFPNHLAVNQFGQKQRSYHMVQPAVADQG